MNTWLPSLQLLENGKHTSRPPIAVGIQGTISYQCRWNSICKIQYIKIPVSVQTKELRPLYALQILTNKLTSIVVCVFMCQSRRICPPDLITQCKCHSHWRDKAHAQIITDRYPQALVSYLAMFPMQSGPYSRVQIGKAQSMEGFYPLVN